VIAPENPPVVDEKVPVMPVISSIPGLAVVVRVMVPEALKPLPVMVKVAIVVPARACGAQTAAKRRPNIPNVYLLRRAYLYSRDFDFSFRGSL
jgi:hypothetical protein